jgi:predicted TIM-barrel fold metal-dependent hydrolase
MVNDFMKQGLPVLFIPFLSVNPRRPDALERIDRYLAQGCRGAKFLQNYWGVDLYDQAFVPCYERLAEHGVPLNIHIGDPGAVSCPGPAASCATIARP